MSITVEEVKAFIQDAKKFKEDWEKIADKSWAEIKKKTKNGRLWSVTPNSLRIRSRYPVWYSIFKIRQPLVFARIGIPIGRDTTQDGSDNVGAAAAMCLERLAINIAKGFNFFDTFAAARDDLLATNFAEVRGYYERSTVKQKVREYLTYSPSDTGEEGNFVTAEGEIVYSDDIYQDDEGKYFIEHNQVVDIDSEKVYLCHVLYKNIFIDPGITNYDRCKRIAFEECYSRNDFKRIFGMQAYLDLPQPNEDMPGSGEADQKEQNIYVYEYWDIYEKETKWLPKDGDKFIVPKSDYQPEEYDDFEEEKAGLYGLKNFFPCPPPLVINAPTDEFWPTPEFFQLLDMIEDLHNVFSKMVQTTKAIRTRLIYDASIEGLKEALNELGNTEAIGVSNLSQSLASNGGSLAGVVQAIPVAELIEGLNQLYIALNQRLESIYKLSGTSDLLQGLTVENSGKTLGERQIEEKYATNQLYEFQRKMAEFVRAGYQLLCEMALKNFKDASLDKYIIPQTLPEKIKPLYRAALQLLKDDPERFRVDLDTDSTIALNEQYDKQMRVELVNALTTALEKTATIAQTNLPLVRVELHCLKYLIQGFRQGKMFQAEITEAIDNVISQVEESMKNPKPEFNKDQVMAQLKAKEIDSDQAVKIAQIQSDERIEAARINQKSQIEAINNQIENVKLMMRAGESRNDLQLEYDKLRASIGEAQNTLALKRDEILIELRKVASKEEMDKFTQMIEMQTKPYELALENQRRQIDKMELAMRERDQMIEINQQRMVDAHTNVDNFLQAMRMQLDAASLKLEANKQPELPDITVNLQMPEPKSTSKKVKIKRNELGEMESFEASDIQTPSE